MKILAVIITYNPDYLVLNFNLSKLVLQVDEILIINNGASLNKLLIKYHHQLIENSGNVGVAKALNMGLDYAYNHQFDYLLSMDQDSILTDNYVSIIQSYFTTYNNVGIVGPNIIEKNLNLSKANNVTTTQKVSHVITSGSLNLVEALVATSGFEEKLFIDMVDLDICYKVNDAGYNIIKTSELVLEHLIGDPKIKTFLFKKHIVRNHPPFRKYFFVRNRLYIAFKYRKRGIKFVLFHMLGICYYIFLVICFEKNKFIKLKIIILGIFDFLRGNYSNNIMPRR